MSEEKTNDIICPVCGEKTERWTTLNTHAFCSNCNHDFQIDLNDTIEYDIDYIAASYDKYHTTRHMSMLRAGFVQGVVGGLEGKINLLDIGYGNGDFLKTISMSKNAKFQWNIYGYDIHGINYGIREIKYNDLHKHYFHVITAFDSIEHMSNFEILKKLNFKYFVVTCPFKPFSSYGNSFNETELLYWKHFKPKEHLHHFSIRSIETLFKNTTGAELEFINSIEDVIRGKNGPNDNTFTAVFKK